MAEISSVNYKPVFVQYCMGLHCCWRTNTPTFPSREDSKAWRAFQFGRNFQIECSEFVCMQVMCILQVIPSSVLVTEIFGKISHILLPCEKKVTCSSLTFSDKTGLQLPRLQTVISGVLHPYKCIQGECMNVWYHFTFSVHINAFMLFDFTCWH